MRIYRNRINSIHTEIWESEFSSKSRIWWQITYQNFFLPKTRMVGTVHVNIFYVISLQISDAKSRCLTKTYFSRKQGSWLKSWKCCFWSGKKTDGVQQNTCLNTSWNIPYKSWMFEHIQSGSNLIKKCHIWYRYVIWRKS